MAITVYSKPGCVQCTLTKNLLSTLELDYTEVDVLDNPSAKDHIINTWGFRQLPVVDTGDDVWCGFRPDRLRGIRNDN